MSLRPTESASMTTKTPRHLLGSHRMPFEPRKPSVVLLGTYPPTECGLATYTANLRGALQGRGLSARVVRLLDAGERPMSMSNNVVAVWRRGDPRGVDEALDAARASDLVLVQHEFGIYPGRDGEEIIDFVQRCDRPIITVLHTVLEHPTPRQLGIVNDLTRASNLLVVHSAAARVRLLAVYDIDPNEVEIVPHGAQPNLTGPSTVVSDEPLMLTWGLLGPGKGIEHGIEAVAILRRQGLDVRYLVAGETHPNVHAREGERYRDELVEVARCLGVADLVDFDAVYRDWKSLRAIVRSAALVLLPYDSRDQVTSGVLVEALAAGKPVVATAFPHAIELSHSGAVVVVGYEAPDRCAASIRRILTHPRLRQAMEAAARIEGARYNWSTIGRRFEELAVTAVDQEFESALVI